MVENLHVPGSKNTKNKCDDMHDIWYLVCTKEILQFQQGPFVAFDTRHIFLVYRFLNSNFS